MSDALTRAQAIRDRVHARQATTTTTSVATLRTKVAQLADAISQTLTDGTSPSG